ncbi:hypothetical protein L1049_019052 [Liquidambar formosana]|uniref:Reverse transcriptase domain-containing protein n=1 Tax=Liquidambar formosana TaxID=63359 RepID=A0AAP0WNA3_LIQFO
MKNNKGKIGWMSVKLDLEKAYDRLEWPFIKAVMAKFGFDNKFISWIMSCIESASFSILLNGVPKDDCIIYANATIPACRNILKVLQEFGNASGQKPIYTTANLNMYWSIGSAPQPDIFSAANSYTIWSGHFPHRTGSNT